MGGQFSLAAFSIGETTLVAHYKYVYDGQGNIVQSLDITNEKCYNYDYEEGRLVRATEANVAFSGEVVTSESSRTKSGLYIIGQWNSATDISQGAHFYAVKDSAGLLTPYNGAGNYTSALAIHHSDFASMISYENGGSMIYAYRIG